MEKTRGYMAWFFLYSFLIVAKYFWFFVLMSCNRYIHCTISPSIHLPRNMYIYDFFLQLSLSYVIFPSHFLVLCCSNKTASLYRFPMWRLVGARAIGAQTSNGRRCCCHGFNVMLYMPRIDKTRSTMQWKPGTRRAWKTAACTTQIVPLEHAI